MPEKTVAVVGASRDRHKYGNRAVRAYVEEGYRVYPIHPREETIEGLRAYPSILDVPGRVHRATLYVPPEVGLRVIEEIAQKGVDELFVNPGAESEELLARAEELGLEPIVACSIMALGRNPEEI